LLDLEKNSPLAFSLILKDGRAIGTVGEAADFLSAMTSEARERLHWKTAIVMLDRAMQESRYLMTASINLRSALVLERLLDEPAG